MRVLQLIDSLAGGGAETSLAEIAPHLANRGVDLHVGYFLDRDDVSHRIGNAAKLHTLFEADSRRRRILRSRDLISVIRPDVVHTTLFEADLAGRLAGTSLRVPVVSSIVNTPFRPERTGALASTKLRLAQASEIATALLVARFHAISESVKSDAVRRIRVPAHKIDVVYRGRDLAHLGRRTPERRLTARRRLSLQESAFMILAIAREEPQKDLETLLAAFFEFARQHPSSHLVIAGRRGRSSPALDELVALSGLEDRVHRLGHRTDVAELLCAADVFAIASRWEGLGGVLLEAMALECPVICSDLPVLREVVGGSGSATWVDTGSIRGFTSAFGEACMATRQDAALAAARRRIETTFGIELVADQMVEFYRRSIFR